MIDFIQILEKLLDLSWLSAIIGQNIISMCVKLNGLLANFFLFLIEFLMFMTFSNVSENSN